MVKKKIVKEEGELVQSVQEQRKMIPIRWNVPDTMISNYASNVLVQILENEFKFLFFEQKDQLRFSEDEPISDEVRADCFASIVVSSAKIPLIIDVLQKQYAKYEKIQQARMQIKNKID